MTKRDKMLLLVLIGVVLLALAFIFVYRPVMTKTDALNAEISTMSSELAELQEHYDNLDYYESESQRAAEYISGQMARYPQSVRTEDQIMYAISLQDKTGVEISTISFSQPEAVLSFMGVAEDGESYSTADMSAYQIAMNISCTLGYQQMKNMIDFINAGRDRSALESLNISFDSQTGELAGSATIYKYYISSPGDEYSATVVPNVPIGTDDLFSTVPQA